MFLGILTEKVVPLPIRLLTSKDYSVYKLKQVLLKNNCFLEESNKSY